MVQENIENRVGFSDCPFITGVVGSADLEQVFAQWQADFDTWFEELQYELSGDVAANLQRQINYSADRIDQMWGALGFENNPFAVPVNAGGTGGKTVDEAKAKLGLTGVVRRDIKTGLSSNNVTTRKTTSDGIQHVYWSFPSAVSVSLGAGVIEAIVDITATLNYSYKPTGESAAVYTTTETAAYHVYAGYSSSKIKNGDTPGVSLASDGTLRILAKNDFASIMKIDGTLNTVSADVGTISYTVKYLTTDPSN